METNNSVEDAAIGETEKSPFDLIKNPIKRITRALRSILFSFGLSLINFCYGLIAAQMLGGKNLTVVVCFFMLGWFMTAFIMMGWRD